MELATFGAILKFALELEQQSIAFYAQTPTERLAALWTDLADGARRREQRLQEARRELVAEMILEPIVGLSAADYQVRVPTAQDDTALLEHARALEEVAHRFYCDAAAKMPIREVARLFQRFARENSQRLAQLDDAWAAKQVKET